MGYGNASNTAALSRLRVKLQWYDYATTFLTGNFIVTLYRESPDHDEPILWTMKIQNN